PGRDAGSGRVVCVNGRPTCDVDRNAHDDGCSFALRLCINNQDPRLPYCTPSDVATFEMWQPQRRAEAGDTGPLDAINAAVGPGGLGISIVHDGAVVMEGVPNTVPNRCSAWLTLRVPLGRKTLRMFSTSSDGRRDADSLTLECVASTSPGDVPPLG